MAMITKIVVFVATLRCIPNDFFRSLVCSRSSFSMSPLLSMPRIITKTNQ